jgi:hypothetical protein
VTEEAQRFDILVYNVLVYEPHGTEARAHPIRAAYDVLEDSSSTVIALVNACREQGLLPADFPLNKSIKHIVQYGADDPSLRDQLPGIPPEERLCLNLDPYREVGRIPGSHDDFKKAYKSLLETAGTVGAFAFSTFEGDAELERIMQSIETDFPELDSCFWFACSSESEPLSETVKKRLEAGLESGSRSVLFYNRQTAVLAARRLAERILEYPRLQKRTPRNRIETGFWTVSSDGTVKPAHTGPKNLDYYVSKYSKNLQERAIKPGGLTPDDFDLALAEFKVESRFANDDQRFVRVSRALQREYNYLLKIVTKL